MSGSHKGSNPEPCSKNSNKCAGVRIGYDADCKSVICYKYINTYFEKHVKKTMIGGAIPYIKLDDIYSFRIPYSKKEVEMLVCFFEKQEKEKEKVEKLLELEQKSFEWLSEKLLSGEYRIVED